MVLIPSAFFTDLSIDRAVREGVAGLFAFYGNPAADAEVAALRRRLILEEEMKHAELLRVMGALAAAGVRSAILKGTALAHTHYPAPWTRTRADLDVLVPSNERSKAGELLKSMGYRQGVLHTGTLVTRQDMWIRDLAPGAAHMVDVHGELTNRVFFAAQLPAAAWLDRSVPAPFAGPNARQLDPIDALLLSCVHRLAHHADTARLVWMCDIWLQAAALTQNECEALIARASASGVASISAREITDARAAFGEGPGALAESVIAALAAAGRAEPARVFYAAPRGLRGDFWLDFNALPGWSARARLIKEHLFPPVSYMRRHGSGWLPWLYVRRIALGASKWTSR